jgi:hypothetical protein
MRSRSCNLSIWKYDRFARSLSVLVAALEQFHSLGVDFISYTQHIDTTTLIGRLFYHVIGSFAEFERELIVERVRAGLVRASRNVIPVCGRASSHCGSRGSAYALSRGANSTRLPEC